MTNRSMFLRILWKLLGASLGRLTLALVALSSGAAICSALLNVNLDAGRKLTQEFRTLGANVVVAPPSASGDAALADAEVLDRISGLQIPQIVAAAPYLYVAAKSGRQPVILAGTDFGQVAKMNSWWKVEGNWVSSESNGDRAQCLVGRDAARHLGLTPGSRI
ncbi:MAG: ABC transporter permease, partial [Candidatus Acidiferrales bacterium]